MRTQEAPEGGRPDGRCQTERCRRAERLVERPLTERGQKVACRMEERLLTEREQKGECQREEHLTGKFLWVKCPKAGGRAAEAFLLHRRRQLPLT